MTTDLFSILTNFLLKHLKYVLIIDLCLFVVFTLIIDTFRYLSVLLTGLLFIVISHLFIRNLFNLIDSTRNPTSSDKLKNKILNFLFRNQNLYDLIKRLVNLKNNEVSRKHRKSIVDARFKTEVNFDREIEQFLNKFSKHIIESWYLPNISTHPEFPTEVQRQIKPLMADLFKRLNEMNKLSLFARLIFIVNRNFLNFTFLADKSEIDLDSLHPAIRNPPLSEMAYLKRFVKVILKNSTNDSTLTQPFVEEILTQLVGKNLCEKLVELFSQPAFVYYSIALVLDKERTRETFATVRNKNEPSEKNKEEAKMSVGSQGFMREVKIMPDEIRELSDFQEREVVFRQEEFGIERVDRSKSIFFNYDFSPEISIEIISLEISDTETVNEIKSGRPYTLYNIRIEYRSEDVETILVNNIKRRFKEFVALQKRLEENSYYRPFLKNIKGPLSKFLILPIGNMDAEIIERRRKKLNEFLNKLIRIPEIFNSRELSVFLEYNNKEAFEQEKSSSSLNLPTNTETQNPLLRSFSGVMEKISLGSTLTRTNSVDPATLDINKNSNTFEYTNDDTYDRFKKKLANLLNELSIEFENEKQINHLNMKAELNEDEISNNNNNLEDEDDDDFKVNDDLHFSQNLLEIVNKLIIHASSLNNLSPKCWFNNKFIYKILQVCVCDFYLEKFFEENFDFLLSESKLVEYLKDVEDVVFEEEVDDENKSSVDFLSLENELYEFDKKLIIEILPKIIPKLFSSKRIETMVELILDSVRLNFLNKHLVYCLFDLLLYSIYNKEFSD